MKKNFKWMEHESGLSSMKTANLYTRGIGKGKDYHTKSKENIFNNLMW